VSQLNLNMLGVNSWALFVNVYWLIMLDPTRHAAKNYNIYVERDHRNITSKNNNDFRNFVITLLLTFSGAILTTGDI
jgi:hypothetical protein